MRSDRGQVDHTNEIFFMNIGGSIQVKKDREIISIVCSIEFGDIEQALSTKAVVEITRIQGGISANVKVTVHTVDS